MSDSTFREHTTLGRTGLKVSRLGLAGGYGVPARAVERAFHEEQINFLYWEGRKKRGMRDALRTLIPYHRSEIVLAVQTFGRPGYWIRPSVHRALQTLGTDHVDILFLGWFNKMPGGRVLDAARRLMDEGKVRYLGVSGHHRPFHGEMARGEHSPFDVLQVRYNAAHRGAEEDVFKGMAETRPGITTYTATRWGQLLKAKKMPPGEKPLTAAECYRFVLSHPAVDTCWTGPGTEEEMDEGLKALAAGPLGSKEVGRARKIGDFLHG